MLSIPTSIDDLLDRASPQTHRVTVASTFGYWVVHLLWSRTWQLDSIRYELFDPPGFLSVVPDSVLTGILSATALAGLSLAIGLACLAIAAGRVTGRVIPLATCALLYLHEAIVRGFSGHVNHGELPLLALATILAVVGLPRPAMESGDYTSRNQLQPHKLAMLAHLLVIVFTYFVTGLARLAKDPLLLVSDELRHYLLHHQIASQSDVLRDQVRFPGSVDFLLQLPSWALSCGLLFATLLEIGVVLMLRGGRSLVAIPTMLLGFHVIAMFALGPFFPELMMINLSFLIVIALTSGWPEPRDNFSKRLDHTA